MVNQKDSVILATSSSSKYSCDMQLFREMTCTVLLRHIMQADKDHDGRLTLEEMVENPYAFYGSVYLSSSDNDDEDYFHDEFR